MYGRAREAWRKLEVEWEMKRRRPAEGVSSLKSAINTAAVVNGRPGEENSKISLKAVLAAFIGFVPGGTNQSAKV